MKILITSGGTKVPIDRVRDITNMSNGTFGSRIARVALDAGHEVTYLCAKHSKTPFSMNLDYSKERSKYSFLEDMSQCNVFWHWCENHCDQYDEQRFRNFDDYADRLEACVRCEPDIVILAAAVSDYGVMNSVDGKIRTTGEMAIEMFPLPKLIGKIKEWYPECCLVGFKLLVDSTDEELLEAAFQSAYKNDCDLVVANDLRDLQTDNHRLILVPKDRSYRVCMKNESKDPLYLAQQVMKEAIECHEKFCSESPVA